MKTKEELLKIYSAYLPYELKVLTPIWSVDKDEKTIQELHSVTKNDLRFQVEKDGFFNCWFETCKPVLHSMDMLTKEIEHKCEKFIPIDKFEIGDDDSGIEYDHGNIRLIKDLESISKYNSYHDIQFLPFEVVQRLIEWHFNVFGLDESEYINKATLKNSSNG